MADSKCVSCGKPFDESHLVLSDAGLVCESCEVDIKTDQKASAYDGATLVAFLASLVPFFFHYQRATWTNTDVNWGSTTQFELFGHASIPESWPGGVFDVVGVIFGLATLIACAIAVVRALKQKKHRGIRLALPALVAVIGLWQLLYGFAYLP